MSHEESVDVLFDSVLTRFFAIPSRRPVTEGVSFAQMRMLWTLDQKKSTTPGELARTMGVSKSSATELIDKLVKSGYVLREHSSDDRRQVLLTAHMKGRKLLEDFAKRRRERFQKLRRVLDRRDMDRMARALTMVNRILAKWKG